MSNTDRGTIRSGSQLIVLNEAVAVRVQDTATLWHDGAHRASVIVGDSIVGDGYSLHLMAAPAELRALALALNEAAAVAEHADVEREFALVRQQRDIDNDEAAANEAAAIRLAAAPDREPHSDEVEA